MDKMLLKINPTKTKSYKELQKHYQSIKNIHLLELFRQQPDRPETFSIDIEDVYFDYSKNIITKKTLNLLFKLCKEVQLQKGINAMFNCERINETENRQVLHIALRDINKKELIKNKEIKNDIHKVLKKIKDFSNKLNSNKIKGYTNKKITDIVNIGIGGSDLGPKFVCSALEYYKKNVNVHFVSNVDPSDLKNTLDKLNPETTLFIIASKTFTTQETMTNAKTSKNWFLKKAKKQEHIKKHFIALSTNIEKVKEFGINEKNLFEFWDFVGGRYSLWSAIGLSISCYIGYENFEKLLLGANYIDNHFKTEKPEKNIPVIMALLSFWYNNFFKSETRAIIPYDSMLEKFPKYLQQLIMESNGKNFDRAGKKINYQTSEIIWGEIGTDSQHSFFQMIHQGTKLIPIDFLAPINNKNNINKQHELLIANFLAQQTALLKGKTKKEVLEELQKKNLSQEQIDNMLPYKIFSGNKSCNTILYKELNPYVLGKLIAIYEHKTFVEGLLLNIYSFDQFGVELGKELATSIYPKLLTKEKIKPAETPVYNLINKFKFCK
jgi:glucose-6-phosphate isomerase